MRTALNVKQEEQLWPGTGLAWKVLVAGLALAVGMFPVAAMLICAVHAVHLAGESNLSARFWCFLALMTPFPAIFYLLAVRQMRRIPTAALGREPILRSLGLELLMAAFCSYFLLDLLLGKLAFGGGWR